MRASIPKSDVPGVSHNPPATLRSWRAGDGVKQNTRYDLVWERLDDGTNVIRAGDEIICQTKVETLAQIDWDEYVQAHDPIERRSDHGRRGLPRRDLVRF